jgi:2-(1,2-epoxy-1,2-dihydrophenyl)acetyl-CoA isomerase
VISVACSGRVAQITLRRVEARNAINPAWVEALAAAVASVAASADARAAVAGGGLGLLWCADVVLLADDARLATAFNRLGISGDGGSSWYLPRMVGTRRAIQLILGGRILDAAEALDWGLADRVVPVAELAREAGSVAEELASGPTVAYGEMRRLIREAHDRTLSQGLDAELAAMGRCGLTADAREGVTAFAQRRSPRFGGR